MTFKITFLASAFIYSSLLHSAPDCYKVVWSDNFSSDELNLKNWSFQTGNWLGSNVQNCYVKDNVSVLNGLLHITAKYSPSYACNEFVTDYTSGFIQTRNRYAWKFGYFEARIKNPQNPYLWPAFWLSPQQNVYGPWPQSGEIDIMEIKGHDLSTSYSNAHWGDSMTRTSRVGWYNFNRNNDASNWHTYSVQWGLGYLHFFVDGNYYHSINMFNNPNATIHPGPFNTDFYIRLNLAVGGDYLSPPWNIPDIGKNNFPSTMLVDWVNVYQLDEQCKTRTSVTLTELSYIMYQTFVGTFKLIKMAIKIYF